MLHNFLNPFKQQLASVSPQSWYLLLSGPRHDTSSSQPRLTLGFTWESPSPAQVPAISDCFIAQAEWHWEKYRLGLTLVCTTWESPEPTHPVDSYRPHQSTSNHPAPTQVIFHRGWMLVVSSHSQSLQLAGLSKFIPLIC